LFGDGVGDIIKEGLHPRSSELLSGKEAVMSVAKVIEITAMSPKSFEDAIQAGIKRAATTVKDIRGAWIKEQKVIIKDGKITEYRVHMNVTFLLR
jgi:hypothetical protein